MWIANIVLRSTSRSTSRKWTQMDRRYPYKIITDLRLVNTYADRNRRYFNRKKTCKFFTICCDRQACFLIAIIYMPIVNELRKLVLELRSAHTLVDRNVIYKDRNMYLIAILNVVFAIGKGNPSIAS